MLDAHVSNRDLAKIIRSQNAALKSDIPHAEKTSAFERQQAALAMLEERTMRGDKEATKLFAQLN